MALIDIRCLTCDQLFEVHRAAADWPKTPPCPECGHPTEQAHLPKRVQWTVDPVEVFQAPDGSIRFPGDRNGLSAKNYERQGFKRIEIRGAAEMRSFERFMNKAEYSRAQRTVERQLEARERNESRRSAEIRHGLQQGFRIPEVDPKTGLRTGNMTTVRLSERGRDLMRSSQRQGEARPRPRVSDPGFFSEVYSVDRSNRDDSRDAQGRRRRD